MNRKVSVAALSIIALAASCAYGGDIVLSEHVESSDMPIIKDAFEHGYLHNCMNQQIPGGKIATLNIQCTSEGKHQHISQDRHGSTWVRDLYWGYIGWIQAGDTEVLNRMRTSLEHLILAKNNNQALGQSEVWPLADERFYIPQAVVPDLGIPYNLYPWCTESQADFVIMCKMYWEQTGDLDWIKKVWADMVYVTKNIELLDTNGNALPDQLEGSYDYQWMSHDTEEALMSAKAHETYRCMALLACELGKDSVAERMEKLAEKVKVEMNKPVAEGGFWKDLGNGKGYYINTRTITKGNERTDDKFVPYQSLVPMYLGLTTPEQDAAVFKMLDGDFDKYYDLKYGPMYIAPVPKEAANERTVMDSSSTPWLGFLDVYLRCKKDHTVNRSKIFKMLLDHAWDVPDACFSEGAGPWGFLTGGAGRSWDNANFFHTLVVGIYGLEKSNSGITVSVPVKMEGYPLTELNNFKWKQAVYDFEWKGSGDRISSVTLDGKAVSKTESGYLLNKQGGKHKVVITL